MSFKILVVLKATVLTGEISIIAWETFLKKLDGDKLLYLMPQILISIQPLLTTTSANTLIDIIFIERKKDILRNSKFFI